MISAAELRLRELPSARHGLDEAAVRSLIAEAAATMESLETERDRAELALAEAQAAAQVARSYPRGPSAEEIAVLGQRVEAWVDKLVLPSPDAYRAQLAIGKALFDAEMAVAAVMGDLHKKAAEVFDSLVVAVSRLEQLSQGARTSVEAAARLPQDLAAFTTYLASLRRAVETERTNFVDAGSSNLAQLATRQSGVAPSQPGSPS